jgi:plasmid stabilization system protein ParE
VSKWLLVFTAEAAADVRESADWYRQVAPQQVGRFRSSVRDAYRLITSNPFLVPADSHGLRHKLTRVFPYAVWYDVHEVNHTVLVIGVVHTKRDDQVIRSRL